MNRHTTQIPFLPEHLDTSYVSLTPAEFKEVQENIRHLHGGDVSVFSDALDRARRCKKFDIEMQRDEYIKNLDILEVLNNLKYDEHGYAEYTTIISYKPVCIFDDELESLLAKRKDEIKRDTYYKVKTWEKQGWYQKDRHVRIKRPSEAKRNIRRKESKSLRDLPIAKAFATCVVSAVLIAVAVAIKCNM